MVPFWRLHSTRLAAAAGGSAFVAAVAGAGPGHDGAAGGAGGGVSHVVEVLHGGGGVVDHPSAGRAGDPGDASVFLTGKRRSRSSASGEG